MARYFLGVLLLSASSMTALNSWAEDPAAKPNKVKVELRWVETRHVEGLTEEKGFMVGYNPLVDTMYPHKKPALVLTATEVAEARLKTIEFTSGQLGTQYMVEFHLTKDAREKLAASYEGNEMKLLTILVDDKYWGVRRYEKDKNNPAAPEQTRAENFVPSIGYISSQLEAYRIVDAFK